MLSFLKRFFDIQTLLGKQEENGELPSSGEMYRSFLKIAWPSVVESVLIGFVGIADTMMVGQLGDNAINAVGIVNQPKLMLYCPFFALSVGITALVSRRKGAGKREEANQGLRNGLMIGILMILLINTLGYIFAEPFLRLQGADPIYIKDAVDYFRIIVISLCFTDLNVMINAAQKGSGNTRISMTTNLVANLVNVCCNYLLIGGHLGFPRLEVRGAAIATAIGSFCGLCVSVFRLLQKDNFISLRFKAPWKPEKKILAPLLNVSAGALVDQLCLRIGMFLYNMIVARLSGPEYSAHLITMNILNLSYFFADGFQVAATSLVGQSLGAGRKDKAYIYCGIGQRCGFLASVLISITFITLRYPLVGIYSDTPEVIRFGGILLLFSAVITFLQTSTVVYTGCLRGAGDTKFTAKVSLFCIGLFRPAVAYVLTYPLGLGIIGAWIALTADIGSRCLLSAVRVHQRKWLQIRL